MKIVMVHIPLLWDGEILSSGDDLMMKHHLIVVQLDLAYHFQEYSEE